MTLRLSRQYTLPHISANSREDLKLHLFRDLFYKKCNDTNTIHYWESAVSYLLNTIITQNKIVKNFLKKSNIYKYSYDSDYNLTKTLLKNKSLYFISGGAAYRHIVDFVNSKLGKSISLEQYAPRTNDWDTSFGIDLDFDYCIDVNKDTGIVNGIVAKTVIDLLIQFTNWIYEYMIDVSGCSDYWDNNKNLGDMEKNQPIFVNLHDHQKMESPEFKKHYFEKDNLVYTHPSGKLDISYKAKPDYFNIRLGSGMKYINNLGEEVVERDHIVELVFWRVHNPTTALGLKESRIFLSNTYQNLQLISIPEYYGLKYIPIELIVPRIDLLFKLTILGMTARAEKEGKIIKCRQDYSRLISTYKILKLWPRYLMTQGNVRQMVKTLKRITLPIDKWHRLSIDEKNKIADLNLNQYEPNYVQCRTQEPDSILMKISNKKYNCLHNKEENCGKIGTDRGLRLWTKNTHTQLRPL